MDKTESKKKQKIKELQNSSLNVKYYGLLITITNYLKNPNKDNRNEIKNYVLSILKIDKFIDFFIDNL